MERGKKSPLCAHACAGERRRMGETGRKFSSPQARMHACVRRREAGEGERNRERERDQKKERRKKSHSLPYACMHADNMHI